MQVLQSCNYEIWAYLWNIKITTER